jgi:AcrR family transcriptional regulator
MARWEPNASGRLREAATELYLERGYEQTTVADIAQRAGLTARTFFRYFADKREVLFDGSAALQEQLVNALEEAPESATPMEAVAAALDAAAAVLGGRRDYSRQRQAVIAANAELRERELIKMASLSAALADGLRKRGVTDPEASLAAEAGIAVFRVAFDRWVSDAEDGDLSQVMRESLQQLTALTSGAA